MLAFFKVYESLIHLYCFCGFGQQNHSNEEGQTFKAFHHFFMGNYLMVVSAVGLCS